MENESNQLAIATPKKEISTPVMADFADALKIGKVFAASGLVPTAYVGKPADCAIAVDMAQRMGVSPLMVMQQLYVVKGKPSWSGQACLCFIRQRFTDVRVIYTGERGTNKRGCYITAKDGDTELAGTEVTIAMAIAEGWLSNTKWKNMPEQMLAYRAGAFFARVYCPDVLMGCHVEGEAEEISQKAANAPDPFAEAEGEQNANE